MSNLIPFRPSSAVWPAYFHDVRAALSFVELASDQEAAFLRSIENEPKLTPEQDEQLREVCVNIGRARFGGAHDCPF